MFEELGGTIREEVVLTLFHAHVELEGGADAGNGGSAAPLEPQAPAGSLQYAHETAAGADVIAAAGGAAGSVATAFAPQAGGTATATAVNDHKDVGRNDPCWCGSGKKFKKCHGA
jgi:preprotein translocase subunit SecA